MATVIKLTSDLIGKEDINWGNSDSTWARETYTGGSTNIHYVDDKIIPATIGGYIDDHLHRVNQDTGTTSSTFAIDTDGTGLTLSSSGLTAGRTFTFPDTSNQALVGATDLVSTTATYGASRVGVVASTYYSGTNVQTVLTEIASDVSALETSTHNRGMKNGFKLGYSSATAVTIKGGMWALTGTTDYHVYTASQITFTLGPAGSNGASSNLGNNEVHYIYIDESSVTTSLLTAANFINSTTEPAWTNAKVGWYNGSDRCIGAILTDGSGNINSFSVFSKHYYRYATPVSEVAGSSTGTTYATINLTSSVPVFSTMCRLRLSNASTATSYYFDTSSTSVTPEAHLAGTITVDIPTSSTQRVYYYAGTTVTTYIDCAGYYIDEL